ncbi:fasciclin-3-like isoform X1 [Daphnia carinata]|uniref:fasciclin-3-like isoform X1 n=1 Tax=Daphnia carinata TaxID=120202 RepID=UPI002580C6B6|nr:fasciclin-3-like isoform X1 [Daphnia carinata]
MTRLNFISLFLLIGIANCQVTIEPQNIVVRQGEVTRLMCKTRTPIENCLWEINGDLFNLLQGSPYEPFGILEDGECGIQARITEAENGVWSCRVFLKATNRSPAERASANVTVLALPQISLRPMEETITVIAGETTTIDCLVSNARPVPAIMWMLGDRELDFTNTQTVVEPRQGGDNTKVSITSKLNYAFQAVDHDKSLRCVTTGPWLTMEDPHQASAQLNVIFPPQPKDDMTLYGFVLGQPGDITVNFTANPRPSNVVWKLDSETELAVEPFTGRSSDPRVEVSELRSTNATSYEARLRIKSVSEADARRIFRLVVESSMNGEPVSQEYMVRLSTSPAPLQCNPNQIENCSNQANRRTVDSRSDLAGGVSGGGIAAIVIVLVAVLVVTAVVLYARNTGRWCFAGSHSVGVSTKESADEEAGEVGPNEDDEDNAGQGDNLHQGAGEVKVETSNQRQSLTHRISSLYETLISKTAPKKSAGASAGIGNAAVDIDAKEGAIVYAELDLKTPAGEGAMSDSAVRMIKDDTTEYAEIVPVKGKDSAATTPNE